MFLSIWNYLKGYVIIRVSGFSIERFVNLAVHKKIYIWDVSYSAGSVTMKVSVSGFKMLRECSIKTKCHIKILEKHGIPFFTYKHRKRKIFAIGILFFIFAVYGLSSFIWLIEVKGNSRIPTDAIITFFEEQNLAYGTFKHSINKSDLEEKLMIKFTDISWVNINLTGTKITIDLSETLPTLNMIDRNTPTDLVASKDGLIESVTISGGRSLVKEKDVVKEGDVLVSGILYSELDDGTLQFTDVHASGEVRAKIYYEIPITIPLIYEEKVYTGDTYKEYTIQWFGENIDLNFIKANTSYENYDRIINRTQLKVGEDYPLPILWITNEYREYELIETTRTYEDAAKMAEVILNSRIIRELPFEADITNKEMKITETDYGIDVIGIISAIERIDTAVPINNKDEMESLIIKQIQNGY